MSNSNTFNDRWHSLQRNYLDKDCVYQWSSWACGQMEGKLACYLRFRRRFERLHRTASFFVHHFWTFRICFVYFHDFISYIDDWWTKLIIQFHSNVFHFEVLYLFLLTRLHSRKTTIKGKLPNVYWYSVHNNELSVQLIGFKHCKPVEICESVSLRGSKSSTFTLIALQSIAMYDFPFFK